MNQSPVKSKDRSVENQWLAQHQQEYAEQWIALDGARLIAHGKDAAAVFRAADEAGIDRPLVVYVEALNALPFAGW